jgi:hypothetical protein
MLVFVLVSEDNFGEGSTSTSVVDNVSHDTLDIPKANLDKFSKSRRGAFLLQETYPALSA